MEQTLLEINEAGADIIKPIYNFKFMFVCVCVCVL